MLSLVAPSLELLPAYVDALKRGYSPESSRPEARFEEIERIGRDAAGYIAEQAERDPQGRKVRLPDGTLVDRLPCIERWMWDGEFCGTIGFRWKPGTTELPPTCLGHIGYSVVPWKQRRGYATAALQMLLPLAKAEGLPYVEIVTNPDNLASQRVIEANDGVLFERFVKPPECGGIEALRYRISLLSP